MTADERRTAIIVAARREFSRSGYHGASTARIAAAARCSEPMLYKHFSGKQELFSAVLADASATIDAEIDHVLSLPGCPVANWLDCLPAMMTNPMYAEMVSMRKLAVTALDEPGIGQLLRDGMDHLGERVRQALDRARQLGTVKAEVEADTLTWTWLGLTLAGAFREAVEGPGAFAEMLPHAQAYIRGLLSVSTTGA